MRKFNDVKQSLHCLKKAFADIALVNANIRYYNKALTVKNRYSYLIITYKPKAGLDEFVFE